ncbi:hypothetical protein ACHAXH_001184 [Discostella pseudostelligera]
MLNRVTGLSPLEILPGTCSDHQDLLCTHVWGCPLPGVCAGSKIAGWEEDSQMESTIVAGHISPQFYVVFDDHFHTVNGVGQEDKMTNVICDLLWDINCETQKISMAWMEL